MSEAIAMTNEGGSPVFLDLEGKHHPENGTLLGFWLYLMSDCLIFACLFAAYGVLGRSYAAGPSGAELFDLSLVAVNTGLLLLSSITYGFAMIAMQARNKGAVLAWLAVTGLLGAGFIGLELYEFAHLIHEGAGPQRSRVPEPDRPEAEAGGGSGGRNDHPLVVLPLAEQRYLHRRKLPACSSMLATAPMTALKSMAALVGGMASGQAFFRSLKPSRTFARDSRSRFSSAA